ncbi:hypothetical protein [Rheinheimera sp.]|uniref:hypothetical protein n=1 Tax=Rheinheimera sp. TaxID=1869214 RepID=UPI00404811E2
MSNIAERNNSGQYYINTRLGVAKTKSEEDFPEFDVESIVHKLLTDLIEVNAKGFRGVVVTAITGIYLNKSYDPLKNFYGCNPRSIFEGGIWQALQQNGIPCGKSDPLNVAKNANQLNEDWAQGRRPQSAAMAVVKFLRLVMESNLTIRARLIDYFFFRLWKYSQTITGFQLAEIDSIDYSQQSIGNRLVNFTLKHPESGHLPQYLVAQLLSGLFRASETKVLGGDESVFGTNTTSRKPADIWLEVHGIPTNLYEVTVKPVSLKRLDDSLEALNSIGYLNRPVTFICRMDTDVKDLNVLDGSLLYKGKRFDFVDFRYFCLSVFSLLSDDECALLLRNVTDIVQDKNISIRTKSGWNEFFDGEI